MTQPFYPIWAGNYLYYILNLIDLTIRLGSPAIIAHVGWSLGVEHNESNISPQAIYKITLYLCGIEIAWDILFASFYKYFHPVLLIYFFLSIGMNFVIAFFFAHQMRRKDSFLQSRKFFRQVHIFLFGFLLLGLLLYVISDLYYLTGKRVPMPLAMFLSSCKGLFAASIVDTFFSTTVIYIDYFYMLFLWTYKNLLPIVIVVSFFSMFYIEMFFNVFHEKAVKKLPREVMFDVLGLIKKMMPLTPEIFTKKVKDIFPHR